MNEQIKITHRELCIATAKKFNKILALYEYKSYASAEEPDVLIFDYNHTKLFEIKISMADFKRPEERCKTKNSTALVYRLYKQVG